MKDPALLFHGVAQRKCEEVAQAIVDEIQTSPITPRDTGRLAKGYRVEKTEDGAKVVTNVDYWDEVEFGHNVVDQAGKVVGHEEAQPHVRPAIEVIRGTR